MAWAVTRSVVDRRPFVEYLRREHNVDDGQERFVEALLDLYEDKRVAPNGRDEPLHRVCPNCQTCWQEHREREPEDFTAGISVPWVGRRYADMRVAVVAVNLNNMGGYDAQWVLQADVRRELQAGSKMPKRSPFGWAVGCYLDAITASLAGREPAATPRAPQTVAELWEDCALLEFVKCSPTTTSHADVSAPSAEMWSNCGPFLLPGELDALSPRVLILLDKDVAWNTKVLLEVPVVQDVPYFDRLVSEGRNERMELLCLNHPSSPTWRKSYKRLVKSLREHPLGA